MSWSPHRLGEDIAAKPALLRSLAGGLAAGSAWEGVVAAPVLLLGVGSSRYAAEVGARRMRTRGLAAVAESSTVADPRPSSLNVVISAGGSSTETVAAARRLVSAGADIVAVTNDAASPLAELASRVVTLDAGTEVSGVASKSFAATLVRLLELELVLAGEADRLGALVDNVRRAADAVDELLAGRAGWLDDAVSELLGPDGTWLLSPLERWSTAMQGALMLREVPRRAAVGCETGEWSHVDVYLTKTLDYRAVIFPGSPWDAPAVDWLTRRDARFWTVGSQLPGAARALRYAHDSDPVVALLAEVTAAELLAAAAAPQPTDGCLHDGTVM
jgi:glucosamine 6-phosphate synthetase-like amidotransferase/phosphosugar isomerase protein